MAKRSAVLSLPPDVKRFLDESLVEGNFSGYEQIAEELKKRGYALSKSSVHRYGQQLEDRLAAIKASTEAAQIIVDSAPDEGDARSEAILGLIQTELFDSIMAMQAADDGDPQMRVKILSSVAKSIAQMSRASVNQKKWSSQVRDKIRAAANEAEDIAKNAGMSDEDWAKIRAKFLGIQVD